MPYSTAAGFVIQATGAKSSVYEDRDEFVGEPDAAPTGSEELTAEDAEPA